MVVQAVVQQFFREQIDYTQCLVYYYFDNNIRLCSSVDEIALKDVPSMLQLVAFHSEDRGKIIYLGHSLGTSMALMYASEYPDVAAKTVGLFVLLTPAYKLTHMRSPYRVFFPFLYPTLEVTNALNVVQLLSGSNTRNITRPICLSSVPAMILCLNTLNLFLGPFTQIAPESIPIYFNQIPGGTSLKTVSYLTESTRGRFRKYNYGAGRNRLLYGSDTPPEYDIKRIKVPIYLMYAANDWCVTKEVSKILYIGLPASESALEEVVEAVECAIQHLPDSSRGDVLHLYNTLPKDVRYGIYEISNLNFNHYDFLFGRNSKTLVTDKLIQVLEKATTFH
ncbi:hypothetical protein NQ318_020784 [Aromia moschata]|uniref:AB hydrolase-1 domain-containing protein n=1 Tax=Aromia moschata TaxID=1265417 RepID=A0AAV8YBY5_9CUCU|nr:hypothetical protein NQ318_020784 [Aromia moschata]